MSDIAHYLPFLASMAHGNILEIGVRQGESTGAFLSGIKANGGHLYSVDIDDCSAVSNDPNWSFLLVDSKNHNAVLAFIPKELDVLFIDGDHSREGYLNDLLTYSPLVKPGGLIISHDIDVQGMTVQDLHSPSPAIREEYFKFIARYKFMHYELSGFPGLGVIEKRLPKILIGFITAHHTTREPHVAIQRERMKGSLIDYKFVYGANSSQEYPRPYRAPEDDELFFECDDTRPFMVLKDKALFQWAMDRGYDFVFRACDDTVVYPERILQNINLLVPHDYAGTMCGYGMIPGQGVFTLRYLDYMHGGVGVWLSRRAMEMLVADDWKGPHSSPYSKQLELTPGYWFQGSWHIYWDDLWMGEVLKGNLNYNDPQRNNVYGNYLVTVLDAPNLFASKD